MFYGQYNEESDAAHSRAERPAQHMILRAWHPCSRMPRERKEFHHGAETLEIENMPGLVIVTGMSGAGRTEAMHVFEDLGYFSSTTFRPTLFPTSSRLNGLGGGKASIESYYCDARNGDYFGSLGEELSELKKLGVEYKMLFLDADDDKLVSRYKSSRRRHPMCTDGTTIARASSVSAACSWIFTTRLITLSTPPICSLKSFAAPFARFSGRATSVEALP